MGKVGNVEAEWSGGYPCLCHGKWTLKVDGKDVSDKIPENLRDDNMNTYKSYQKWHFDEGYREKWEYYNDGLRCEDWIEVNGYWLNKIVADKDIQKCVFYAINEEDWRHSSCGGCI